MQEKNCILAIDEGRKRVGIALTDESGKIPFPYKTIKKEFAIKTIVSLLSDKKVSAVVIGLPFNTDGSEGYRYNEVINFAREIMRKGNVTVIGVDERYSTEEAKELLKAYPGKRTFEIDAIEALIILKRFLNNEKTYTI